MKTASWLLGLLMSWLLIYSFAHVPESDSIRVLHVASRYQQRSEMETGLHSKAGAVAADYRSTDLLAAAVLLSTAALCLPLFFKNPPRALDLFPGLLLLALGVLLVLGTGVLCMLGGSNFLDFEGWVPWVGPFQTHLDGALALLGGALLSLGALLVLALGWFRSPGGSSGR